MSIDYFKILNSCNSVNIKFRKIIFTTKRLKKCFSVQICYGNLTKLSVTNLKNKNDFLPVNFFWLNKTYVSKFLSINLSIKIVFQSFCCLNHCSKLKIFHVTTFKF